MTKVLIDTTPLQNANSIRGVGVYTKLLIEALQKNKKVEVFTDSSAMRKSDLDMVHYPFFDLFFPTLPLLRKHKTVVTIHDVIPLLYPEYYRPGKKGRLMYFRQLFALRGVQAIITDSEASKADIIKYLQIKPDKVHVVYLAANPELIKPRSDVVLETRKKLQLPEKYILYVGDINYNKNLTQLIKSLKFLPEDVHLVCVGKNFYPQQIPEWQWIETQIAMTLVEKRVHFVSIPADQLTELAAVYTGALCYVQASLYEGFGLPVLEAMQCRTPVVSAQNSSLVEVGGTYVQFTDTTAESIASGVERVLEFSDSRREQVVKDAYAWSQHFSWEKTAAETVKVYQHVAAMIKP